MSLKLIGKKQAMTQVFDDKGNAVAVTVITVEPNVVVQKKTKEIDGYNALQLGSHTPKNLKKPLKGHFAKAGISPKKVLKETRVEKTDDYNVGQEINVSHFAKGDFVDVQGVSKGKGYQGVMKLHNFAGGPGAHGSGFHRHAGSTGMRTTPGRCWAGGKRASQMGFETVKVQNLLVVDINPEKNLLIVKGSVPGFSGSFLTIAKAVKKGA
jgi:large subunit ribosomal protein L3